MEVNGQFNDAPTLFPREDPPVPKELEDGWAPELI
jgi:hypothetical protein